jgi:hypothetical protein
MSTVTVGMGVELLEIIPVNHFRKPFRYVGFVNGPEVS